MNKKRLENERKEEQTNTRMEIVIKEEEEHL